MSTKGDTLCVARFFGPARWVRSEIAATDEPARSERLDAPKELLSWDRSESWFGESPADRPSEVLDIDSAEWAFGEGGSGFVRAYPVGT